jgi:hypothetical protein
VVSFAIYLGAPLICDWEIEEGGEEADGSAEKRVPSTYARTEFDDSPTPVRK